jgi:hypothetical protein
MHGWQPVGIYTFGLCASGARMYAYASPKRDRVHRQVDQPGYLQPSARGIAHNRSSRATGLKAPSQTDNGTTTHRFDGGGMLDVTTAPPTSHQWSHDGGDGWRQQVVLAHVSAMGEAYAR